VERALDIRTAEAIAVRYDLAGLGSRFLALAVDGVIQAVIATAVLMLWGLASIPLMTLVARTPFAKTSAAVAIAVFVLAGFVLFFGYFIIFELVWNGQSPGKRIIGIRVVRDGGFPVDAGASIVRNVVRIAELALGAYVFSAVVMLFSPENKRAGDYAAGTIVVRDRADAVLTLATIVSEDAATDDGLDRADRTLIDQFLARRATLEPAAAAKIASKIAARVRPKLRASFHYLDDVALLEHLARSRG
jgi:uncharacterized RDD family membrane protein YckC